jgi:hypothetical protein
MIINLFGEKHTWPAFTHLAPTALSTANCKLQSDNTINGSLPPNSITDLFKYLPAISAIEAPDLLDPVKLTPIT